MHGDEVSPINAHARYDNKRTAALSRLNEKNPLPSFTLTLAVALTVNLAEASELSGNWLSLGPSFSYVNSSRIDHTWGTGVELSFSSISISPGGKDSLFVGGFSSLWATGGVNWLHTSPSSPRVYGEIGSWLLFSLGVGFSSNLSDNPSASRKEDLNLFIGLPIPLPIPPEKAAEDWLLYVHPYYRPYWTVSTPDGHRGFDFYEIGILTKIALRL
jgi:hypothetical protein